MKQFLAFVRKEFYHVFRDRKTLLLLFGMPIAQIILFGFALTNEIKNTKIVICDRDPFEFFSTDFFSRISDDAPSSGCLILDWTTAEQCRAI